jgi:hypothetical protein
MASITMSANSSEVDVVAGPGAGCGDGSAFATPIIKADSATAAPATTNDHRIATPLALVHSPIPREVSTGPHPPHAQHD